MSLAKPQIILTEEQKVMINDSWDKIDMSPLTAMVFNDPKLDARSNQGRAIKEYLAGFGKVPVPSRHEKKGEYELTDYQVQFINTNARNIKPIEMLKVLFPEMKVASMLSAEGRAIIKYLKEHSDSPVFDMWDEPVEDKEYKPPMNFLGMIGRANLYIPNSVDPSRPMYNAQKLKSSEEKNLKALMAHMKTARFRFQASQYEKNADRVLFESTFIRFVADKAADLTPEEVDTYIATASETLNIAQLERRIISMEKMVDDLLTGVDDDGERKKLSLNHVELVNALRTKQNDAKKLREALIKSLDGSRAERIDHRLKQNASVIVFFDAWVNHESRLQIIGIAEKEKQEDTDLVNRLSNMDDVMFLIAGMTKDEASRG